MSLRRPFVAPRSTREKRPGDNTLLDNDGELTNPKKTGVANQEEEYQTPISKWRVSNDEEDSVGYTRFFSPQLPTKTPCVSNWELRVRGS